MEEWKEYKLGDVAKLTTGFPFDGHKYSKEGIRVVRGDNVTIGSLRWDSDKDKRWSENFDRASEFALSDGDIVIGMDGSRVGKNRAQVKQYDLPLLIAQRVACVRHNELSTQQFLYYHIFSDRFEQYIKAVQTGTSIPHVSLKQIGDFPVIVPSIKTQQRIASILSSLDDKIEVNRKINDNLEQQAQALFKSWFVDFEPFKDQPFVESELGMIPEGWRVEPLANIMNFQEGPGIRNWQYVQNGGTKFINIRCIKDGDIYTETANMISNQEANGKYAHFMLQSGDIVMSCSGTLGRYAIVREDHLPLCLNTSVIRFKPISNFDYSFVLGTLTSSYFLNKQIEMACGSVQANFGPTHLKQMKILVPPEAIRTQYNEKCYPIIHLIQKQKYESRRLAELRDTLLPKLMSGELKVNEI